MKLFALLALSSIGVFTHVAGAPAAGDGTIGERKPLFDPLPAGAPDGLHIATLNEDGTTHWEYLGKADPGNSTVTNAPSSLGLDKRAKQGAYCQGGYIASSQFAGATQGLANMCGQGLNYATLISYRMFPLSSCLGCSQAPLLCSRPAPSTLEPP